MSEEEATGSDFTLSNAGLKPAPTEPVHAEPEQYSPGFEGIREAANELTRERGTSETEPVERHLEWKTGHRAGDRVDMKSEGFSLTPESAAKVLSEVHRNEDARDLNPLLNDLAHEVDLARAQASGRPDPVQEAPTVPDGTPQPDSPQAEYGAEPSTPGIDPDFAALLEKKPQLRAQLEAPFQAAEATRQAYNGAVQQVAEVALSSVLANFPELSGYSAQQLPTVLAHIQKTDPQRAALIHGQLQQVNAVYSAAQQAKQQQAAQLQEQHNQWVAEQDAQFEKAVANESPETIKAAAKEIVDFAKSNGLTEQQLGFLWQTNPVLRSSAFQQLLMDAARFRMAQRTATSNRAPHGLPPVIKPGVAQSVGERSAVDLSELRNQFRKATGTEQLKLGAKLTRLQRESRR